MNQINGCSIYTYNVLQTGWSLRTLKEQHVLTNEQFIFDVASSEWKICQPQSHRNFVMTKQNTFYTNKWSGFRRCRIRYSEWLTTETIKQGFSVRRTRNTIDMNEFASPNFLILSGSICSTNFKIDSASVLLKLWILYAKALARIHIFMTMTYLIWNFANI